MLTSNRRSRLRVDNPDHPDAFGTKNMQPSDLDDPHFGAIHLLTRIKNAK